VDPRSGLDDKEKRNFLTRPRLKLQPLSRPARSQSLYRLSHPAWLMLFRETVTVYCENHTEHAGRRVFMLKQVVHIVTIGLESTQNLVRNSNCIPLGYGADADVSEDYVESVLMT
jgi:hypothetical protein